MTGRRRVWVLGIALLLAGSGSSAVLSSAASQTPTASTRGPAGLSDLPANMFVALELPGLGQGIPGHGMKHVTWAYNPINKRLYAVGGDYAGEAYQQSYRQEVWSLSLAERWVKREVPAAGWRLEYPYCGPADQIQPKHPDFVGWMWDAKRSLFWMMPGTMVASNDTCPGETVDSKSDPGFPLGKVMTFDPGTRTWTDQTPNGYTAGPDIGETWMSVYDPVRDEIVRFGFNGGTGGVANILDVSAKRWRVVPLGLGGQGREIRLNKEYLAPDLANRQIYAIDGLAGRLYRWSMDRRTLADLGPVPGGSLGSENITHPVWNSVSRVLLWYRAENEPFHIYHPDRKQWESVPVVTNPPGLRLRARAAVFDPDENVLMLLGGLEPGNPYLFLYRYAPMGQ
jgi:hypothetical protein